MHSPKSLALLGIALLNNATHGFSHTTLPSAYIRSPSAIPSNRIPVNQLQHDAEHQGVLTRGGALASTATNNGENESNLTMGKIASSAWGTFGVAYILLKAIRRVLPIALEPFGKGVELTKVQLG